MRVNVYAEELTDRVEVIEKTIDGQKFTAVRFYLELPVATSDGLIRGPFLHRPGDDDSAAVTFWGKKDLRPMLQKALELLDKHRGEIAPLEALAETIAALPPGTLGIVSQSVPPYREDLIPFALHGLKAEIEKRQGPSAAPTTGEAE